MAAKSERNPFGPGLLTFLRDLDRNNNRNWFEQNKDRVYFTDVGGYKFLVVPQGYLDKK